MFHEQREALYEALDELKTFLLSTKGGEMIRRQTVVDIYKKIDNRLTELGATLENWEISEQERIDRGE